jgi:hypothetical protein
MKKLFLSICTVLLGLIASLIFLAAIEFFFRENERFHWIHKPQQAGPPPVTNLYDSTQIDFSYLKDLKPFPTTPDWDDPDDYSETFRFKECPSGQMILNPYWIGAESCTSRFRLLKRRSRRVVYDTLYSFNEHGLRIIPAATPDAQRFLLFLGCSFTYGEGIEGDKIFPNLITQKIAQKNGPINAFNLGMGGYGPHLTDVLFMRNANDVRLSAIRGTDGIAIYTFIDDQLRRAVGSMTWARNEQTLSEPFFHYKEGRLTYDGSFEDGRPLLSKTYRILAKSATLSFFNVEFPSFGADEFKLFADLILDIKARTEKDFHVKTFIFSVFPGERRYASKLIPLLEKGGVIVFDFSNVDVQKMLGDRRYIYGNAHPSELAHRVYSDLFVYEAQKRHILETGK